MKELRIFFPGEGRGPSWFYVEQMPYVYILTNKPLGTLYTGFTNDLARRMEVHKARTIDGFSKEHSLTLLVWYEFHEDVIEARTRERLIKKWHRDWKVNLIQAVNPDWRDLSPEILP